ncbi:hypothetical protein PV327_011207, partial [Microctonus hyperodae]
MDDLLVPLVSEEVKLLKSFPPQKLHLSDIIYKHFVDQPPANISNFVNDVVNYQKNVQRIVHLRECETIENLGDVCSKCIYTHDGLCLMIGKFKQMSQSVSDLMMTIFHLRRECEDSEN